MGKKKKGEGERGGGRRRRGMEEKKVEGRIRGGRETGGGLGVRVASLTYPSSPMKSLRDRPDSASFTTSGYTSVYI